MAKTLLTAILVELLVLLLAVERGGAAAETPQDSASPETAGAGADDRGAKARIHDADVRSRMESLGGTIVADYGAFAVYEAAEAVLPLLGVAPAMVVRSDYNRVALRTRLIDTLRAPRGGPEKSIADADFSRFHIVQFRGPIRPQWYEALAATGARVISYLPANAYIVYAEPTEMRRVIAFARSSAAVQWDGPFLYEDKILPDAAAYIAGRSGADTGEDRDLYAIQLVHDPLRNPETTTLLDRLALEQAAVRYRILDYVNIIVRLPMESIAEVARRPDVLAIDRYRTPVLLDERQDQIIAGNISGGVPSEPGYLDWLASKGFTQAQFSNSGFAVDITDSGVDDGTTVPTHPGLYELGDMSRPGRIAYNRMIRGNEVKGCDGHGTINAHIIAGYNDGNGFPYEDTEGFHYGLGVCPFVRVGGSDVIDEHIVLTFDKPDLISGAYEAGARISSNSWGGSSSGNYTTDAQTYDALVRDAQPEGAEVSTPGNQEMTIVFAAGNDGPGGDTIGSPGTGKNIITVGAAENVHPFGGVDACGQEDSDADDSRDMADFSSRGPCDDGRKKPELVAPGTHITGGLVQDPPPNPDTGMADSCFRATGVCGGTGRSMFFPADQELYTSSSGTSHSTPAVAGGAALVRQYFLNQRLAAPSPAMVKAYLMSSARYLSGAGAGGELWSNDQGMGEMDLGRAFDDTPVILRDQLSADRFTATGQSVTISGVIADDSSPYRVTLAWTDAPGALSAAQNLYNDLDLTVTVDGQTYLGNVFGGRNSTTGGDPDSLNNVESVFLPEGTTGAFTITVTATNINSDGIPNTGGRLDQDFALVVYNAQETALFVPGEATLMTEDCSPGNGAVDPGEVVTVELALQNVGSAATDDLVGTLLPGGGVSLPGPPQRFGVVEPYNDPVSRPFTFRVDAQCGATVSATLQLQDGDLGLGTLTFEIPVGAHASTTQTFASTGVVAVPLFGPAEPYPSVVTVSGLDAPIEKLTVTLDGFSHTVMVQVEILLVGPDGTSVVLMGNAGSVLPVVDLILTFDDDGTPLPRTGLGLNSGTYRPTNFDDGISFETPAPQPPYGDFLDLFTGKSANGNWQLFVQDKNAHSGSGEIRNWSLSVTTSPAICCVKSCPDIKLSPSALPAARAGVDYDQTLSATGGAPPYSYSILDGALPEGISLDTATGALFGTPIGAMEASFTVIALDSAGCLGMRPYSLTVKAGCPPILIAPTSLPPTTVGETYLATVGASGGFPPYEFELASGTLPPGLDLNADTGQIGGRPTSPGTFDFEIIAIDAEGCDGSARYSIGVAAAGCPIITLLPESLPGGVVGEAYGLTLAADGGTAPYVYTVSSGGLPAGIGLMEGGALTGLAQQSGEFVFFVTATDAAGCAGGREYTLTIAAIPGELPDLKATQRWARLSDGDLTVTSRYRIKNAGAAPAGAFSFRLYLSPDAQLDPRDELVHRIRFDGLNAGEHIIVVKIRHKGSRPLGGWYLISQVDPLNEVVETDEINNIQSNRIRQR
ncbi:MAG: S8 family serine peptidase [Acidobacteria bacterium]|nr:S8 family serine peptidase [Acidobacteriota bacterium]